MGSRAIRVLGGVLAVALTAGLIELGAIALVGAGVISAPQPHHGETGFWWHHHPVFGAWHRPDTEGDHNGACFKAHYEINSVGARDVERPRRADGPRVVVLGDSFFEGYGVDADSRVSNMLEARTGIPHLNFAMASFGPYQELLVYEALAREFDHTAVLASVFPGNDFADMDPRACATLGDATYCYRPFPGAPPELARVDRVEPALLRWLRVHSQAWNVVMAIQRGRSERGPGSASYFYAFEPRHVELLEAVLERLRSAAAGRELVVVLIPSEADLAAFAERGPDPLSQRLSAWAQPRGVRVVNLLPAMAEHARTWSAYYLSCDFHWARYGNRVAADLLLAALPELYGSPEPASPTAASAVPATDP